MSLVRAVVVHVKHPNPSSSIRRLIYYVLQQSGVNTDIGWVLVDESALDDLRRLSERALREEGVDPIRVYEVYLPVDTYRELVGDRAPRRRRAVGVGI